MSVPRLPVALVAALILAMNACSTSIDSTLTAPDAYAMAQSGNLTLIDVQRPDEWRDTGIAQGAIHIDMTSTQGAAGFVQQTIDKLNGNMHEPIGLISQAGNRSENAQQTLHSAGFTHVYNIKEGMLGSSAGPGWIARGLPVETVQALPNSAP
ncbi:MAG: rhodanese-like domain-containing protein [Thiobacillus sp.]